MKIAKKVVLLIGTLMAFKTTAAEISFKEACSKDDDISILAVGDILVHIPLQAQAVRNDKRFVSLWSDMEGYIKSADIAYANLEGPIAANVALGGKVISDVGFRADKNQAVYTGFPGFNYHPYLAVDLKKSGFDIVSTANNHSLDRRAIGVDKTLEELEKNNIAYTGTRRQSQSGDSDYKWHTTTVSKGRTIAWLACTFSTNGIPDTKSQVLPCFQNQDFLLKQIRDLSNRADIDAVIVTPHWGDEYVLRQNAGQQALGRKIIEAGATAVIGTHPHVVQPWEKYTTASGREGLIVYSTGNFVSNQAEVPKRTSVMVQLHLTGAPKAKLKIRGSAYLPMFMQRAPLLTIRPVYNLNEAPLEAKNIWLRGYGESQRITSLSENQVTKFCENSK